MSTAAAPVSRNSAALAATDAIARELVRSFPPLSGWWASSAAHSCSRQRRAVVTPGPLIAATSLGRKILPDSEDYYPAERRRLGIEGAALVRVCVDAQGGRQGEPLIEESSRDAQLDAAALNVARHGRYTRAEQGGVAVPNCYRFHIVFRQTAH